MVVVVGAVLWPGSRSGKAEVKMIFVGFTNDVIRAEVFGQDGQTEWVTNRYAVLLVTNAGPVALYSYDSRFGEMLSNGTLRTVLGEIWIAGPIEAGRSKTCKIWLNPYVEATRRDVSFKRWGLRDRLRFWFYRHNWMSIGDKLTKPPDTNALVWATTGWITNPPPVR
jgi:hypothetical protein